MHDPQSVAFEIKNPFAKKRHGYRPSLITIWHVDPENFRFKDGSPKLGGRGDDSCGWFSPMYSEAELAAVTKLAKDQYGQIFARQVAEKEGKSYAYISNMPETTYEVLYWCWRAIKKQHLNKKGWQYGSGKPFLSLAELEEIMKLATNPVDNFKHSSQAIRNEEQFIEMFRFIWINYKRFRRPWYQHPRWHIHHWKIQFHPFQNMKRRYWDKCSGCGKRGFRGAAYGNWNGDQIWHSECRPEIKKPSLQS